ncbi:hypothetical protein [Kribbella sp.]|uniref:hypothetical protein n=1 Tax=Kribbella sp. TaxID=1871183 RepID=UPI002D46A5DC|nr:hypothetical protein [Kribbella sp.]HZX06372.1 hypothetical protein [Kribbella sp.]
MTEVDLSAVYDAAEKVRELGTTSGAWLTGALKDLGPDSLAKAFGGDDMGRKMADGFSQRFAYLSQAGAAIEQSLLNIGDGITAAGNLVEQVDGHNADALRAADLDLQTDGMPLPANAAPPAADAGRPT